MNLESKLRESSQTQKVTYCINSFHMQIFKTSKPIRQNTYWWLPGSGGSRKGNGEELLKGHGVSFWSDEHVLELCRGPGGTTL